MRVFCLGVWGYTLKRDRTVKRDQRTDIVRSREDTRGSEPGPWTPQNCSAPCSEVRIGGDHLTMVIVDNVVQVAV